MNEDTAGLGRQAAGHFRIRGAGRPPERRVLIGQVGMATARFGTSIGRSLSGRQALGPTRMVATRSIGGLPVEPPAHPLLAAFW